MIQIHQLASNSQEAFSLENSKKLGEKKDGKIIYSVYEAFYLIENKKAKSSNKLKLTKEQERAYLVFKDLRKKGYVPKTGLKFGADFRAYLKNEKHARYLVYVANEKDKLKIRELLTRTRISHSTAKKLLIAVIDSQEDISYIEADWVKV